MAINLTKGQRVDIGLSKVGVGLGWDPNDSGSGEDFDLDSSAFMLGQGKKIPEERFFVFYNNMDSADGSIHHSGDDRTGGNSDGDDETMTLDLSRVDARVTEILFTVTIDKATERKQNFGQVRNSFIRIYDATNGAEICKYELGEDFSIETAVEFGRLYRRDGAWKFEAMGVGVRGGLAALVQKYA